MVYLGDIIERVTHEEAAGALVNATGDVDYRSLHESREQTAIVKAYIAQCEATERILAARLAEVTAQRDALVGAAQECVECSATMDSACPECFPDNDYGLRIEGFVCVYRLPHRSSSPNSLTAIAAERGKVAE